MAAKVALGKSPVKAKNVPELWRFLHLSKSFLRFTALQLTNLSYCEELI